MKIVAICPADLCSLLELFRAFAVGHRKPPTLPLSCRASKEGDLESENDADNIFVFSAQLQRDLFQVCILPLLYFEQPKLLLSLKGETIINTRGRTIRSFA